MLPLHNSSKRKNSFTICQRKKQFAAMIPAPRKLQNYMYLLNQFRTIFPLQILVL